jgi:opacity protein-like surface antigen
MKRLAIAALAALSLSACATAPTVYQPSAKPGAVGYSEYRIEPGRYRITFQGGPGAPPQYVTDLALLRAADLALADGYDWFRVSDRFMQGQPDRGPRVSFGVGSASFGRRSSIGVGVGTSSIPLGGGPTVASTLEVVMGKGPRPAGADVYDARALRSNLGQRI